MIEMVGLPILLAALLGFAIFGGGDNDSASGELGDSGDGFAPSDGDDEGFLTNEDDDVSLLDGDDRVLARDGDDILRGNAGDDTLIGEDGDDTLRGGQGDDVLYGGAGDDTLVDDSGENSLFGADGDDVIATNGGAGQIGGGDGADTITATDADVTIVGGAGADTIFVEGGEGVRAFGGDGADIINVVDSDGALVNGGNGADALSTVGGRIDGGNGADLLGSYQDRGDDDSLTFNKTDADGNDIDSRTALFGGDGDDIIYAIEGNTIATGGEGADEFVNQARMTIEDFEPGEDVLVLEILESAPLDEPADIDVVDIVLTEIEINGIASTLVTVQLGSESQVDPDPEGTNLDQTVWIKGVTPDELSESDIQLDFSTYDQAAENAATRFSGNGPSVSA